MQPRSFVTAFLVGAALVDSVLDDDRWERSAGLALMHVDLCLEWDVGLAVLLSCMMSHFHF